MVKILLGGPFDDSNEEMGKEIFEGIDHEMGKENLIPPLHFTKGAMAHLAKFMELVVGLPGTEGGPGNPLWMRQDVKLEGNDYWYKVEVKIERLHKATPPPDDFCEEDYPEHIYPDWMVLPPPMAAVENNPCETCASRSDDEESSDAERCTHPLFHYHRGWPWHSCKYWRERS